MRPEAFEYVEVTSGSGALPLRSLQGAPRAPSLMHLTLLTALAAAVVAPQIGLAGYALSSPDFRQSILGQPLVAFQLAVALAFWITIFALPLRGLADRLTCRRAVEITSSTVTVTDTRAFTGKSWSAPLASYRGIAHNTRSSLSGTRQELVLVHDDRKLSVLLMAAETISDADIARLTRLLNLPQIPVRSLYGRRTDTQQTAKSLSWQPLAA
jgi:hypothetical protein